MQQNLCKFRSFIFSKNESNLYLVRSSLVRAAHLPPISLRPEPPSACARSEVSVVSPGNPRLNYIRGWILVVVHRTPETKRNGTGWIRRDNSIRRRTLVGAYHKLVHGANPAGQSLNRITILTAHNTATVMSSRWSITHSIARVRDGLLIGDGARAPQLFKLRFSTNAQ